MSTPQLIPVMLAGGSGSRLAPLSTPEFPKQFLTLPGETCSLFQQSVQQACELTDGEVVVVAPVSQREALHAQLAALPKLMPRITLLLEPKQAGTAAAIAAAACYAPPDATLWVLPCDHDRRAPLHLPALKSNVLRHVGEGKIVVFGLIPTEADSGYGYVSVDNYGNVLQLLEKPSSETARKMMDAGRVFWNSGMFAFQAETLISELLTHRPSLAESCRAALADARHDGRDIHLNTLNYSNLLPDPIDRVVMERSDKLSLIRLPESGWADIGTFARLLEWWETHAGSHASWDFGNGEEWQISAIREAAR